MWNIKLYHNSGLNVYFDTLVLHSDGPGQQSGTIDQSHGAVATFRNVDTVGQCYGDRLGCNAGDPDTGI